MFHITKIILSATSLLLHHHVFAADHINAWLPQTTSSCVLSTQEKTFDIEEFFAPENFSETDIEFGQTSQALSVSRLVDSTLATISSSKPKPHEEILNTVKNAILQSRQTEESLKSHDASLSQVQEILTSVQKTLTSLFREKQQLSDAAREAEQRLDDLHSYFQYQEVGEDFLDQQAALLDLFKDRITTLQKRRTPNTSSSSSGSSSYILDESSGTEESQSDKEDDYSSDEDSEDPQTSILPWKVMQRQISKMPHKKALETLIYHIKSLKGCTSEEDLNNYNSACLKRTGLYITLYEQGEFDAKKLQSSINDINPTLLRTNAIGIYNKYKQYISSIGDKATKRQRTS